LKRCAMLDTASSPVNRWLFPGWVIFAAANTALMFTLPGQETIPFHFVYISMALVYGFQPWPLPKTYVVLGLVAVTTGAALVWHVKNNVIGWEETAEIPLMALLFLVMVWHVRRRVAATREARRLADSEHEMREVQRRFVRFASHELRTPVTVARGYTELIRDAHADPQVAQDASVVLEELDKLEHIAARLLTLARVDEQSTLKPTVISLDALLERSITRWRATANRDWRLSRCAAIVIADAARLETALDSVVENAVRHTENGGRIELSACRDGESVVIEVRDDGQGIPSDQLAFVFESFRSGGGGTGMGLAIVKAIVEAHGGAVSAENLPDGGAAIRLRIPLQGPREPAPTQSVRVRVVDDESASQGDPVQATTAAATPVESIKRA
jgi:two-component system, OmpR family, sensor kinase